MKIALVGQGSIGSRYRKLLDNKNINKDDVFIVDKNLKALEPKIKDLNVMKTH